MDANIYCDLAAFVRLNEGGGGERGVELSGAAIVEHLATDSGFTLIRAVYRMQFFHKNCFSG